MSFAVFKKITTKEHRFFSIFLKLVECRWLLKFLHNLERTCVDVNRGLHLLPGVERFEIHEINFRGLKGNI